MVKVARGSWCAQERPQLDRPLPAGWPEGGAAAYRAPARQGQGWVPFRHARACTGGPTGHTPRLSDAQLEAVRQALRQGARAHGFDTDHWTLERIATVIEQVTGVAYHPGHVWKLLRRRLGWRLQRPARRAIEGDEQAIQRWVESDWPRIRQKRPSA